MCIFERHLLVKTAIASGRAVSHRYCREHAAIQSDVKQVLAGAQPLPDHLIQKIDSLPDEDKMRIVSQPSSWYEYTHNTRYVHMKRYVMGVGLFHGSMKKIH